MLQRQHKIEKQIREIAKLFNLDPDWPCAIALVESSLGENQKSPTGSKGVFQMTSIAMKDLLQEMAKKDDDLIDIVCGVAFLSVLYKRYGSWMTATSHFCAPKDIGFYTVKVKKLMEEYKKRK